jgi:hypothetical protein
LEQADAFSGVSLSKDKCFQKWSALLGGGALKDVSLETKLYPGGSFLWGKRKIRIVSSEEPPIII